MARLAGSMEEFRSSERLDSLEAWHAEDEKLWGKLNKLIDEGKVINFPVGDGGAYYYIESIKPPVLRWIPIGDAWQIPNAHLRGLRAADLEMCVSRAVAMRKLLGTRSE